MSGSTVKNHISLKTGIRIICNTENFVPIVVPGLSANSSSGSDSSTSRTLSRQESHCSTSSSSSSSSSTVSDTKTREREDQIDSDISPVTVSTTVDERSGRPDTDQANKKSKKNKKEPKREQGDPLFAESGRASSEIPKWLQEFRENLVDDEVPEHRDSHTSSSHEVFLEPIFERREDLCKHSVYSHFPKDRNCVYLSEDKGTMQKTQWRSRTSSRKI